VLPDLPLAAAAPLRLEDADVVAATALAETVGLVRRSPSAEGRREHDVPDHRRPLLLASPGAHALPLLACPDAHGRCEYVAIASEDPGDPPQREAAWRLLPEDALVAVDAQLRLSVSSLS